MANVWIAFETECGMGRTVIGVYHSKKKAKHDLKGYTENLPRDIGIEFEKYKVI